MNRTEVTKVLESVFREITDLNDTKGREYTAEADALANLRDWPEVGLTGRQRWAVYADKHWRAIVSYIRSGETLSEPIEGRINDMILYLILLRALIEESTEPAFREPPDRLRPWLSEKSV